VNLLALDTSSLACSVAVACGAATIEKHEEKPREHTRILVPMIRSALLDADMRVSDLDAIVLGNGPGSFIGMRIAASVAQGMAHAAGLGIVPVSSLAAVAAEALATATAETIVVAQDAHMSQVYLGIFKADENRLPVSAIDERIHDQGPIAELAAHTGNSVLAAGAGWQRYPELLDANRARLTEQIDCLYPRARYLLALGRRSLSVGAAQPAAALTPAYLRQKVAEVPGRPS
jgi:tRNA threonylcarbamoyladenosine biosynthesis protein TsaB